MELGEKLQQILSDEKILQQIREVAAGLSSVGGAAAGDSPTNAGAADRDEGAAPDLGKLMGLLGTMGSSCDDPNAELLRALRPFLSDKRKKRAGEALKLMRVMELLPMLQQSGLLESLMGGSE
ncbi:MAG: hypothetical protein RR276_04745 [Angelakisella sp.]